MKNWNYKDAYNEMRKDAEYEVKPNSVFYGGALLFPFTSLLPRLVWEVGICSICVLF